MNLDISKLDNLEQVENLDSMGKLKMRRKNAQIIMDMGI